MDDRSSFCAAGGKEENILLQGTGGDAVTTGYRVFPGISLFYHDIHTQKCVVGSAMPATVFEIHHCREGRMECQAGEAFFYLSPGDLSVACRPLMGQEAYFPLRHYHGITVTVDTAVAPRCLSCLLEDVRVDPALLAGKFCYGGEGYIARSDARIAHIFSELYSVPEEIRMGYFKIKVLELLLFLSCMDIGNSETQAHLLSRTKVALAKEVAQYLTGRMSERVTLDTLALVFHVSPTQIKNSFREVYGVSVYSYIRTQKMQAAALRLRHTDETVLAVAGDFGYDNASKFAKAFSDVMGRTPTEYRRCHAQEA